MSPPFDMTPNNIQYENKLKIDLKPIRPEKTQIFEIR